MRVWYRYMIENLRVKKILYLYKLSKLIEHPNRLTLKGFNHTSFRRTGQLCDTYFIAPSQKNFTGCEKNFRTPSRQISHPNKSPTNYTSKSVVIEVEVLLNR